MMASSLSTTVLTNSQTAWRMLQGVVCLYKPLGYGHKKLAREFKRKILDDINRMEQAPRKEIVEIRRVGSEDQRSDRIPLENEEVIGVIEDGQKRVEVVKGLSYSDHPLVIGNRFKGDDFKIIGTGKSSGDVSGVHVYGLNKGINTAQRIFHGRWLRTYLVSGQFGIATDNFFHSGIIREKATYGSIKRPLFENLLASTQSSHQRMSFLSSGVPLDSERAYELASQGLVRPAEASNSVVFSVKCLEFNLPHFTIEVKAINEDADYMKRLVHEIGIKLRSVATCTKIQCTQVGPFGVNEALLLKHWNVQNILDNMKQCRSILTKFNLEKRDLWVGKPETEFDAEGDDEEISNKS